jgi:hypothetical protein
VKRERPWHQGDCKEEIVSTNSHEIAKNIRIALKEAIERGQPVVLPWRADSRPLLRLDSEHDAGCGCGPVDLLDEPAR